MASGEAGKGRPLLFKIGGIAAGLAFAIAGGYFHWHHRDLVKNGHTAIVEPITSYTQHKSKGGTTYTAELHWKLQGSGRPVQKRTSFPESVLEDFKAGREVRVYYDPSDPGDLVFENDKPGWWMVGVGAGIAVVSLVVF